MVSLPKEWVKAAGLRRGSLVRLIPRQGFSLLLVPEEGVEGPHREAVLHVGEGEEPEEVVRELISVYQAGFDVIKVGFKSPRPEVKSAVKDTVRRRLMGMEILSESAMSMLLQCFTQHMEFPLQVALERAGEIASSMSEDAVKSLLSRDHQLAAEVFQRDDEVDRLFHYITRQLNIAVERPRAMRELRLVSPMECLSYSSVAKAVERVGDHAASIAQITREINGKLAEAIADEINAISGEAVKAFKDSLISVKRRDKDLANEIVNHVQRIKRGRYEKAVEKVMKWRTSPKNASLIKTILEDLVRIAEYSADIAEQAIFLSIIHLNSASAPKLKPAIQDNVNR